MKQALKYIEILSAERAASQVFIPKLNNAGTSFTFVDKLLENRISVADEGNTINSVDPLFYFLFFLFCYFIIIIIIII